VAGLLLPLGVYAVERVLRLPDATATVALGITGGTWGLLAVAVFADGRSGQGWNGVGPAEYHTVLGQGVTGFIPATGMIGDGLGQMVAQLAGMGAISLLALLVGWLIFLALDLPYRRQDVDAAGARRAWGLTLLRTNPGRQPKPEAEAKES
jgi:Amt family ammonium transporter